MNILNRPGRRSTIAFAATITVGLVITGCSSGGTGTGGGSASGKDTKVTYAIATEVLNVGYPFATLPDELGYFKNEGLNVKIVPGQSSATTLQLLASGKADIGVVVPNAAMTQTATGSLDVKSFYAASRQNSNYFAVTPSSPIKTVKDLKGKKLGVAALGSGANVFADASETLAGVDPRTVQQVNVGYGSAAYQALRSGKVDAYTIISSFNAQAQNAGYHFRLLKNPPNIQNLYSYNIYATSTYIKENPDVIAKIGRATAKATVFLKENPQAAVKLFWKQYPTQAPKNRDDATALKKDLNIVNGQMSDMQVREHPADFAWGSQNKATWTRMQNYLVAGKQIAKPVNVDKYFTAKYQDQYTKFDVQKIVQQAKDWKP